MNKQTKQKMIYARYILPPVLLLLILIFALIPSYRYVAEGVTREPISLWRLISNSWEESRETLFVKSANEVKPQELVFSKTMMWLIIGFTVLYIGAFAVACWSAFVALKLFISDDEDGAERARTLFITFFPNRIVLCAVEALTIPMVAMPYLMPMIYSYTLGTRVGFTLAAPDGFIFALIVLVAISVFSAITAPYERRFDADVFKKHAIFGAAQVNELEDLPNDGEQDSGLDSELREYQAERIRKLLRKKDTDDQ
jgi:hypothetical protein